MVKSKAEVHRRRSLSDPLAAALLPPPDETPLEREKRVHAEIQAKQVSDGIDEMIRQERFEKKKTKVAEVKVLLLGQSESGKSTTLKRESLIFTLAVSGWPRARPAFSTRTVISDMRIFLRSAIPVSRPFFHINRKKNFILFKCRTIFVVHDKTFHSDSATEIFPPRG
jgi:hypothetical protein